MARLRPWGSRGLRATALLLAATAAAATLAACTAETSYRIDSARMSIDHPLRGATPLTHGPGVTADASPFDTPGVTRTASDIAFGGQYDFDDTLLIIARQEAEAPAPAGDERPGSGAMLAVLPDARLGDTPDARGPLARHLAGDDRRLAPLTLTGTTAHARVSGFAGRVEVTQTFENPYEDVIEAVYTFPLPTSAAVNGFEVEVNGRKVRGVLQDRDDAEAMYRDALAQGYRAHLMTREQAGLYTQRIGGLPAGARTRVLFRYFTTLDYAEGWYRFTFPTTLRPEHHGKLWDARDTDGIPRTRPGGNALSVRVDIDAGGLPIRDLVSPTHEVRAAPLDAALADPAAAARSTLIPADATPTAELARGSMNYRRFIADAAEAGRVTAWLAPRDRLLNRDFELRYRVESPEPAAALFTYADPISGRGYAALMIHPPTAPDATAVNGLRVDWAGTAVRDVYVSGAPADGGLPDLEPGKPVLLIGRYNAALPRPRATVRGRAAGQPVALAAAHGPARHRHEALPLAWARLHIADLTAQMSAEDTEANRALAEQIADAAMRHDMICRYTAFIMVDGQTRREVGGPSEIVNLAAPTTAGAGRDVQGRGS